MTDEPETFEEYWKRSPGLEGIETMGIARKLVMQIAKTSFIAGQSSFARWYNNQLKERGL